jgi:hypothetical protein
LKGGMRLKRIAKMLILFNYFSNLQNISRLTRAFSAGDCSTKPLQL